VDVGVLMMPLVPGITTLTSSIERTLTAIAETGARFVGANVAHLEVGVREHFFAFLERAYPHLLDGYRRLYARAYAPTRYVSEVTMGVKSAAARLGATGPAASPSAP
jgi:DNA repair photolyase